MSLLEKIRALLLSSGERDARAYMLIVRCSRCGEIIESRIDLKHDLSVYYDDVPEMETSSTTPRYFCRKTLIGKERCFQRIEVELTFDQNRNVLDRQIAGGEIVSRG
jgi:hypothetical protein